MAVAARRDGAAAEMRAGRIVAIVVGCILGVLGLGLLVAGIAGTVAYGVARDDDGFFRTDEIHLATRPRRSRPTASTSEAAPVTPTGSPSEATSPRSPWIYVRLARVRSSSRGSDPPTDVTRYLASVAHDRVSDYDDSNSTVSYERQEGSATPAPPGDQTFWVAEVTTAQPGALTWDVEGGDWTVVVMNADGSSGVEANARVGIKIDWLLPVAIVLIVVGVVVMVGGILLAVFVGRRPRQQPLLAPAGGSTLPPPTGPDAPPTTPAPRAAGSRASERLAGGIPACAR